MWIHWPFFPKNLNQRSLTPRWPLTPCLLRSHVWLYPRIIVSKSHDNTSMYVDTVINFAKYHIHTYTYYIHTTYILHTTTYRMSDHIVSYWTQFRRDKNAQPMPNMIHYDIDKSVYSDQISRKCDQIFTDTIIFEHALPIFHWKICQLVTKQQYCDYHKSLKTKTTYKSVFGYLSKSKN